ncbi:MAG: membrane protein insertase YidC [Candidatus Omnitrophica bacterium]|nr:membrane protein insertase YidC [Candidatus Omnitrophota bacterium]
MERRLILAIVLSLLVLLSWSAFLARYYPELGSPKPKVLKEIEIIPLEDIPAENLFNYTQDKFDLVFEESKAIIKEAKFKDYQSYGFALNSGLLLARPDWIFQKKEATSHKIEFVFQGQPYQITKRFIFHNYKYNIELEIDITNLSSQILALEIPLTLGKVNLKSSPGSFQEIVIANQERPLRLGLRKDLKIERIKYLAWRERYFCIIVEPESPGYSGFIKKLSPSESEFGLVSSQFNLNPGESKKEKFHIYLGPQELKIISSYNDDWTQMVYFGMFDFISRILLQLLTFCNNLVHNWGLAIIMLSLLVYFMLFPLSLKQLASIKQMQALQPQIEEIRQLYKDNPQRQNKEIMELYRRNRINPLAGCLPLVLQLPIFFALYQVLMRSVVLKGANFLWVKDLTEPDRLFVFTQSLPLLGKEINLLPLLMVITMFLHQRFSLSTNTSREQQRIMSIIFPILFGFIFYRMPAGLVLYWFINSLLMLFQQIMVNKIK